MREIVRAIVVSAAVASASFSIARSAPGSVPPAYGRLLSVLQPGPGRTPPANIAQVLKVLPAEWLSNFTFVYASRSPHRDDIDPLFPRVVLFNADTKLLLAFTGNPASPSYDQLEVIYFDDRTSSFHASRFVFPDAVTRRPRLRTEAASNGAIDRFECTRCHGADVRPIFDSYGLWPGLYGSRTDMMGEDPRESRGYARFLAENAGKGVYRYLRFPAGSPVTPYQDGSTQLAGADTLRFHPNERLGDGLTPLNWKRIVRKLASRGRGDVYRQLRYPLLSGLLGCSTLPVSSALKQSVEAALEVENARRFERAGLAAGAGASWRFRMQELAPGVADGVAAVAYVAKALGVRRADWSMSFEPSALGFFDGVLTRPVLYVQQDLVTAMLEELASNDHEFVAYNNPYFVFSPYGYELGLKLDMSEVYGNPALCALLAHRAGAAGVPPLESVERIDERGQAGVPPTLAPPVTVLNRCANCHDGVTASFTGVEIPFADPVALRQKLQFERSLRTGRSLLVETLTRIAAGSKDPMPPVSSGALSPRERRDLAEYVSALVGRTAPTAASRE